MTDIQHQDLAAGRWFALSLAEQLGNVGSEVSRAIKWTSRRPELARGALERALELIDLMLDDPRHRQSAPPQSSVPGSTPSSTMRSSPGTRSKSVSNVSRQAP